MTGDSSGHCFRVGQERPDVQAKVIAKQARLNASGVVQTQSPEPLDALRSQRAHAALSDVMAAEVAVDNVDLDSVDAEHAAALSDACRLDVLLAGQGSQVVDDALCGDRR
ncbi:hypothetical protein [Streptomyces sp. NBC_01481]|uniref:hypothetical protein n=1 Tax=Streptomyces sp. NBC_01481 TaxID=2975869 RepID=UPI00225A12D7|nr:hypothetical protein [Streptomyces sp. NBC_01481]MCX4584700.1 hypothetical protein [Streptomyces sp. NBC_01481]